MIIQLFHLAIMQHEFHPYRSEDRGILHDYTTFSPRDRMT